VRKVKEINGVSTTDIEATPLGFPKIYSNSLLIDHVTSL
jgi:hypothetical protein